MYGSTGVSGWAGRGPDWPRRVLTAAGSRTTRSSSAGGCVRVSGARAGVLVSTSMAWCSKMTSVCCFAGGGYFPGITGITAAVGKGLRSVTIVPRFGCVFLFMSPPQPCGWKSRSARFVIPHKNRVEERLSHKARKSVNPIDDCQSTTSPMEGLYSQGLPRDLFKESFGSELIAAFARNTTFSDTPKRVPQRRQLKRNVRVLAKPSLSTHETINAVRPIPSRFHLPQIPHVGVRKEQGNVFTMETTHETSILEPFLAAHLSIEYICYQRIHYPGILRIRILPVAKCRRLAPYSSSFAMRPVAMTAATSTSSCQILPPPA